MRVIPILLAVTAAAALAGCGGSHKNSSANATTAGTTTQAAPTTTASQTTAPTPTGPGALQAEANSVAAGDIPDNQVFLTFHNAAAGYTIKYPEGWAQRGSGSAVTLRDKNNIVRIVVSRGVAPSAATVRAEVSHLAGAHVQSAPVPITTHGARGFRVAYATVSAPNAVTGKRVHLVVDRYYLWHGGRLAVLDLGTPLGVDNVDAYRLMFESFRWR